MRKLWSYLIPALILIGVLALQYRLPAQFESFRIKVFDVFQMIKPREYRPTPVRIIDIDDESLSRYGQWPWPRTLLANLVNRLAAGGAKVIVFDGVFPEPDRTSPQNILKLWGKAVIPDVVRVQLEKAKDHDDVFAEAASEAPVVLAFGLTPEPNAKIPMSKSGLLQHGARNDTALDHVWPVFHGSVVNLPGLEKASRGNGCFNMGVEWDQIIRRVPSLFRLNDALYPSLVLEAMRVFQDASAYKVTMAGATGDKSFGERSGITGIKTGLLDIPTDGSGRIWLYDTGYKEERFIPAWKVLSDNAALRGLEGQIVFVGSTAMAMKDLRATPLNPVASGVEVHAQLAEQMFLGEFIKRPDWAEGAEFSFIVLLGIILILVLPRAGAVLCAVLGVAAVAFAVGFSWYAFTRWGLLIDPWFPSFTIFVIYLASSFLNFLGTEKERGQIRGAFGRYLSPVLVEKLAKNPKQLKLGGETREMTFLFTDIRGFTPLAEAMTATELTQFMNSFMTPMSEIILQHSGTIDKYIGDCIMAFWNAPLEDKNHARHACLAALKMQEFIRHFNESRRREAEQAGKPFLEVTIGIGINTGEASVGNMGSEYRFDYTVLGDEVNLASRLEQLTKQYGVTTIIGQNTAAKVPDLHPRELATLQVRGKTIPTRIYTL